MIFVCRFSEEYRNGAKTFVNKAKESAGNVDYIICPCEKCRNLRYQHVDIVYEHLVITGMNPAYDTWVFHGETPNMNVHNEDAQVSDTYRMYRDVYDHVSDTEGESPEKMEEVILLELENVESPLYLRCTEYTRLSATVLLYKHKSVHGLSDKSFSDLLQILRGMLPANNTLPDSIYSTKKLLKAFDLGYEKIDAYKNDCCLFKKENEHLDNCLKCGFLRWKINQRTKKIKKGVPVKVLRYFLIIPRFRKMFKSLEMTKQLTWYTSHKSQNGKNEASC